ncbi:ATP-binding protein [Tritonibacter multivorans]|nr:4Fe-4S binding protein [Tritonibacter multivorans]MDA7420525.1 4Fe-4S binding protein [Tritonibacter multivorans]
MSIQSVPEEDGADDVRVAVKDDDDSGQSSRFSKQDKGRASPLDPLCLRARLQRDLSAEEQVLVLLDQGASDGSLMPAEAGQMPVGITWVTVCQADCLTAEDLCVALKSGFDRVYLQLSADVTRLAGQLQRVEAAALRLGPGQVVSLFHSVEGLLAGWAEHGTRGPVVDAAPVPAKAMRPAELAISGADCTYCGQCAWVCPTGALFHGDGLLSVEDAACIACGVCVATCPSRALSLVRRDSEGAPENTE